MLLVLLVVLGYLVGREHRLLVLASVFLLLYVIVPVAVFRAYGVHGVKALTHYSLLAVLAFAVSVPYALWVAGRLCGSSGACRAVVLLVLLFPNTVFLPLSLAPVLGLDVDVIVSYALPLTLLHFTLGYRLGGVRGRLGVPLLVVIAAAAGLVVNLAGLSGVFTPVWRVAGLLGRLAGFLSVFVVGASLPSVERIYARDSLLLASVAWRSLASPLLHLLFAMLLGVEAGLRSVMVEAVMAPATMNAVIARHLGVDYERVAVVILLHTPIAVLEAVLVSLAF